MAMYIELTETDEKVLVNMDLVTVIRDEGKRRILYWSDNRMYVLETMDEIKKKIRSVWTWQQGLGADDKEKTRHEYTREGDYDGIKLGHY